MIFGIGTDIVEINRISDILSKQDRFIYKVFTEEEIRILRSRNMRPEFVAGRFAAKEAVSKALGTGFREFSFQDIEVINNELGKPEVRLYRKAEQIAGANGKYNLQLSISHGRDAAIAYAILEVI